MRSPLRIAAALALVAAGAGLAFAGASPQEHRTVTDVLRSGEAGDHVRVKAAVEEGSANLTADPATFLLADDRNEIRVRYADPIPTERVRGELGGRTVVVAGTLASGDGSLVLDGEEMEVGCASKYRAEDV